ncbi:MAG: single-stranded DNA-binding protein, partial [Rhodoferax sp.]|nr:single-stranded DNA-binding protein [Rhodoferax sp.]
APAPARQPSAAPAPAARPASGFDDMDDDIPF